MHLKIGSRDSKLALKQTEIFCNQIQKLCGFSFEIIKIKTSGDKILDKPLYEIGGKALFLKELEEALLAGVIDIAVHSLKDIPGVISDDFFIGGFLEREDPLDSYVSHKYRSIFDMPAGSIIGTSSPRRIAMIRKLRQDLDIRYIRGNILSRLDKLKDGIYDGLVLAGAGLRRLNLWHLDYCTIIKSSEIIPAVGQGVIAAEILSKRKDLREILYAVEHKPTTKFVNIEREYLSYLNANCKTPLAGFVENINGSIEATFMLATDDTLNLEIVNFSLNESELNGAGINAAKILQARIEKHSH